MDYLMITPSSTPESLKDLKPKALLKLFSLIHG